VIINSDILRRDTVALMRDIEGQIAEVSCHADRMGISPQSMRDAQGNWPMIPLLLAKAQAYNALILLQTQK
jgi:hypothetical protein